MTNPPSIIREVGVALFGERWRSALASELDINERTLSRWAAAGAPVPLGVLNDLLRLVTEREQSLHDLAALLRQAITDTDQR